MPPYTPTPDTRFIHVQDSFRWLAAADCSWRLRGAWDKIESDPAVLEALAEPDRRVITGILSNAVVSFETSALVYARGLIEFFSNKKKPSGAIDIVATDFGIDLPPTDPDLIYLRDVAKPAINRHLAHLAEVRDPQHPDRPVKDRLDWNTELSPIVDRLVALLSAAVSQNQPPLCQTKFQMLLDAVKQRRLDPTYEWPSAITP